MQPQALGVIITTPDRDRLHTFYKDVVQLPYDEISGGFRIGDGLLTVDGHSEIHGPSVEPARVLINFFVADIAVEHERLAAAGVPCIRDRGTEFWGGIISTFTDPDGNYIQLIEVPEGAGG